MDPSVKISTQTLGETIYQFVDLPGLPSIQERIIRTQDDQVKKALADLGWICPQEAKAAERVIADGAKGPTPDYTGEGSAWIPPKTKPHTFAKMVNEVRDLAFDFGTSEQFRDRVADLLGKYIHVEHGYKEVPEQAEAPAVVVPAWDVNAFALACVKEGAYAEGDLRDAIKNAEMGYNFAISRVRAIPADRVMGDGMVQISERELACMRAELEYRRAQSDEAPDSVLDSLWDAFDALRANQGGSEHGKV